MLCNPISSPLDKIQHMFGLFPSTCVGRTISIRWASFLYKEMSVGTRFQPKKIVNILSPCCTFKHGKSTTETSWVLQRLRHKYLSANKANRASNLLRGLYTFQNYAFGLNYLYQYPNTFLYKTVQTTAASKCQRIPQGKNDFKSHSTSQL